MNNHEHTLKMIYHRIYKFDLYTLKLYKKEKIDNIDNIDNIYREYDLVEQIEQIEQIKQIKIQESKILFTGENSLSNREMIKNIYNIDINTNMDYSKFTHMMFFYRSLNYQVTGDKVIIYFI
jgi:hypothetical protein